PATRRSVSIADGGSAVPMVRHHRCDATDAGRPSRSGGTRANRPPRANARFRPRTRRSVEQPTSWRFRVDFRRTAEPPMNGRRRRGVALLGALALLTVAGIVVAALVASSLTAQRASRLGRSGETAMASAEYVASSILAGASTYQLARLPLGAARRFDVVV